jgi:transcription initiation factor IIF auxiliary subunit
MLSFGEGPSLSASKKLKKQGWSDGSFVIECFYIHYDGVRFGPVNKTFQIQKYESKKDVRSLPVYPIQCDPNADETRRNLEERGERFCELSNPKSTAHRKYRGLTLDKNREQVRSFSLDHPAGGANRCCV